MREGNEGEEEGNNREILGGKKVRPQKRFETKTLIENPNKSIEMERKFMSRRESKIVTSSN